MTEASSQQLLDESIEIVRVLDDRLEARSTEEGGPALLALSGARAEVYSTAHHERHRRRPECNQLSPHLFV